jgi:hypothetical protein
MSITTVAIAKILEEKYHIVENFYIMEEDYISDLIEEAFGEEIEKVMMMKRLTKKSRGFSDKTTDKIVKRFQRNLARRAYDGFITGVPTKASIKDSRPSFIDTGLYSQSFRTWVED